MSLRLRESCSPLFSISVIGGIGQFLRPGCYDHHLTKTLPFYLTLITDLHTQRASAIMLSVDGSY